MNAAKAKRLTAENAHMMELVAEQRMGEIFAAIERSAISGQNAVMVDLPTGYEQGVLRVLGLRGFTLEEVGNGSPKVMVRW